MMYPESITSLARVSLELLSLQPCLFFFFPVEVVHVILKNSQTIQLI